mmetsp:Transcript_44170/g.130186  ORF Transcript_44170/g.130186 Transcript_44170/m.130186 type:complete len:163 (+) Transcript_44170:2349-2837(+)
MSTAASPPAATAAASTATAAATSLESIAVAPVAGATADRMLVSARGEHVAQSALLALANANPAAVATYTIETPSTADAAAESAAAVAAATAATTAAEVPPAPLGGAGTCMICCSDRGMDAVMYRCGHQCACMQCAYVLLHQQAPCPICRAPVEDVVRLFPAS